MHLACTRFRLTVSEAIAGLTRHAARAFALGGEAGALVVGARADIVVWDADHRVDVR
jgi:imidazolonepropionase